VSGVILFPDWQGGSSGDYHPSARPVSQGRLDRSSARQRAADYVWVTLVNMASNWIEATTGCWMDDPGMEEKPVYIYINQITDVSIMHLMYILFKTCE
jgi:hypothetical protein